MHPRLFSKLVISLTLLAVTPRVVLASDAILLSKVDTLTLREGRMTSHRRVSPVPQLRCIGGSGCRHYSVDVMRCKNAGYDYDPNDVQWTCTASLPPEFKLGSTEVMCEGYSSSSDPYILKGSCGVEYRLILTDQGEERYGSSWFGSKGSFSDYTKGYRDNVSGGQSMIDILVGSVFWLLFFGVLLWIIYAVVRDWMRGGANPRPGQRNGGWGGWGGGGGGNDDPPPPYSPYPPRTNYSKPRSSYSNRSQYASGSRQQGWRPGFWTGAATGAAAGYAAGNRSSNRRAGGNSWFGSGTNAQGWDPGTGSSRRSGGSSSSGGARYEGIGFGGTSRR